MNSDSRNGHRCIFLIAGSYQGWFVFISKVNCSRVCLEAHGDHLTKWVLVCLQVLPWTTFCSGVAETLKVLNNKVMNTALCRFNPCTCGFRLLFRRIFSCFTTFPCLLFLKLPHHFFSSRTLPDYIHSPFIFPSLTVDRKTFYPTLAFSYQTT